MFRHTEEYQLLLLWWCALSAGRAPGFLVCWLWPIMLFAQTLFLIGLHPLSWQRGWGNDFEGLGSYSLLLFYTLFVYWSHILMLWLAVRHEVCLACTLRWCVCVCVWLYVCLPAVALSAKVSINIKAPVSQMYYILFMFKHGDLNQPQNFSSLRFK